MCRVFHERCNKHCFFRVAPKISRKNDLYTFTLGENWQNKIKKLELEHYIFLNCSIQVAPRNEQYHFSFRGAPKISRKNYFYTFTLGQTWQNKINRTRN